MAYRLLPEPGREPPVHNALMNLWSCPVSDAALGRMETVRDLLRELIDAGDMLLERFPVPVVPVSIRGTHESMPPGTHLPRPCPVTVRFCTPVLAEQLARNGEGESRAERIRAGLEQRLRALHAAAA